MRITNDKKTLAKQTPSSSAAHYYVELLYPGGDEVAVMLIKIPF